MAKRKSSRASDVKGKKGRKSKKESIRDESISGKGKKGKRKSSKGRKSKKSVDRTSTTKATIAPKQVVEEAVVEKCPEPVQMPHVTKPRDPCFYALESCKDGIACRPNHYPGLLPEPQSMAVVGSECGSYSSICRLLRAAFRCADRVFTMTPWGNYVVFRSHTNGNNPIFFLFDGCTCNVNRFRYLDLTCGTAGLLYFDQMHDVISYIIESRGMRASLKNIRKSIIDDICTEFCEYGDRWKE